MARQRRAQTLVENDTKPKPRLHTTCIPPNTIRQWITLGGCQRCKHKSTSQTKKQRIYRVLLVNSILGVS